MTTSRPFIRALLIDLSGTLHIGSSPTHNAVQAFHRLRQAKIPFRLCSNASKESTEDICDRLTRMGFEIRSENTKIAVWTSIVALKGLLKARGLERPYLLLTESARRELSGITSPDHGKSYDSVVIGLAPSLFTYDHLNGAFRVLVGEQRRGRTSSIRTNIPFIATHKAKYIESSDGALSLGPGPFVTALEEASGIAAEIVGKPSRAFFQEVLSSFESDVQGEGGRIAIIGDDVEADLGGGAVELDLWRILVKTGKYRPGDESKPGVRPPDEVTDSFAIFVDDLLGAQLRLI